MTGLKENTADTLAAMRRELENASLRPKIEEIGVVERIGDGVAVVTGLPSARLQELLRFEDGSTGLAVEVREDRLGCVLLQSGGALGAGAKVHGTGDIIRAPVGDGLLGRVIDPLGSPLDDRGPVEAADHLPIERPAPAIVDRTLVSQPLLTGLTVIDAMVPLGRGQRELLIGDRKTGKTTVAIDTIINQKSSKVVCVYAAIGQKASTVKNVVETVREFGPFERCVFVVGEAEAPPGAQWATPYAACTIAEYFRDRGQDALLIIDDLTKHADVHRQISLLLRQPPGREAYPGDVFHLHSRLLERAAALSDELGGGSLTALPIAETQEGNLIAYVPTNLISITDGQIYFEPKLFYEGQKPAVNVGLSVSRVGGRTQPPAIKRLAADLRLEYAQFLELEIFTRFGAMLDQKTRETIEHGKRIRALLIQRQFNPRTLAEEVVALLAAKKGLLDEVELAQVGGLIAKVFLGVAEKTPKLVSKLNETGDIEASEEEELVAAIKAVIEEAHVNKADVKGE